MVHEALAQCSAEQLTALQEPLAAVQAALQDAEMRSIRAEAKLAHQTSFANVRHYAKKTLRAFRWIEECQEACVTDWRS